MSSPGGGVKGEGDERGSHGIWDRRRDGPFRHPPPPPIRYVRPGGGEGEKEIYLGDIRASRIRSGKDERKEGTIDQDG